MALFSTIVGVLTGSLATGLTTGAAVGAAASVGLGIAGAVQADNEADTARKASALAAQDEIDAERANREALLAENEAAQGASGLGGESPFRLRLRNITSSLDDERRIYANEAIRQKQLRAEGRSNVTKSIGTAVSSVTSIGTSLLTAGVGK